MGKELRFEVLKLLDWWDREASSEVGAEDFELAEKIGGVSKESIKRELENLQELGLAKILRTMTSITGRITPKGRLCLEELEELSPAPPPPNKPTVGFKPEE